MAIDTSANDQSAEETELAGIARRFETELARQAAERKEANAELQWKNRDDWTTRGRLKGLAGMAASSISLHGVGIGSIAMTGAMLYSTHDVICRLGELKLSASSMQAKADIDYIIGKKKAKMAKGAVGLAAGTAVTIYSIGKNLYKRYKKTLGKHREEVAKRILERLKNDDRDYLAIALALFHGGADTAESGKAQRTVQRLRAADEDLAVKVLLGKIASG
jgi:hypothetical protein